MFFFAMEEMLVCGSARPVDLVVGSVCACSTLTATVANVLQTFATVYLKTFANVLPSYYCI